MTFPITAYLEAALELAHYDKLEDGSFAGEISKLKGVAAFGKSLRECEDAPRSTLEDWILVGRKLGHKLPGLAGIDLNKVQKWPHGDHLNGAHSSANFARRASTAHSPARAISS